MESDWLNSFEVDSSNESKVLEESLRTQLKTLQNDANRSSEEEPFVLPKVLFRRPTAKKDLHRSCFYRMIDNCRKKKIAEKAEKSDAPAEISKISTSRKISSTPFHINDEKVPTEVSWEASPIYNACKENQANCLSPQEFAKENDSLNISEKTNKSKKTRVNDNSMKNTSKIKKTIATRQTKSCVRRKTKKTPAIAKRLCNTNVENKIPLNKNRVTTYTTLNPDRRRTYIEESHINLNDKAFDLEEELECDPFDSILNYNCEAMDFLLKSPVKNKLENICIANSETGAQVKPSNKAILASAKAETPSDVEEELECVSFEPQALNYHGEAKDPSLKCTLKSKVKILQNIRIANAETEAEVKKSHTAILASANAEIPSEKNRIASEESAKKTHKSKKYDALSEDVNTIARKRSRSQIPSQSVFSSGEISPNLHNIENIDPLLHHVSPTRNTHAGASCSNSATNESLRKSSKGTNKKEPRNVKRLVTNHRTAVVRLVRLVLTKLIFKMVAANPTNVNSSPTIPPVKDASPMCTVNGASDDESDKIKTPKFGKNKNVKVLKENHKRRGRSRKQLLQQVDDPVLGSSSQIQTRRGRSKIEDLKLNEMEAVDVVTDVEQSQETEPFAESVRIRKGGSREKKFEEVDNRNHKSKGKSKEKRLKLTEASIQKDPGEIDEMPQEAGPISIRKQRDKSREEQLEQIVDEIMIPEAFETFDSTDIPIEGEMTQALVPLVDSVRTRTGKSKEPPKPSKPRKKGGSRPRKYAKSGGVETVETTTAEINRPINSHESETIHDSIPEQDKELRRVNDSDLGPRGQPVVETIRVEVVKRGRGRPRKVQPIKEPPVEQLSSVTNEKVDDTGNEQEEDCFIKPLKPAPKKKTSARNESLTNTYLQEVPESLIESTKKPRGKLPATRTSKTTPVQVQLITTSSSSVVIENSTTSNESRVSTRNRTRCEFFDSWRTARNESSKTSASKPRSRTTISSPKKTLSSITKKKEKIKEKGKKIVSKSRNLRTILEESQLLIERHNINLELEGNDDNHNPKVPEEMYIDSGVQTDLTTSNSQTSVFANNDGVTATSRSSVFVPQERTYKHFLFPLEKDTSNDPNPFLTLPIPKISDSKIGRIIIKPGCRKPNITLRNYHLTLHVSSGSGLFTLQNQIARLTEDVFARAYDGNEYSIFNDGTKDLKLIYIACPSR